MEYARSDGVGVSAYALNATRLIQRDDGTHACCSPGGCHTGRDLHDERGSPHGRGDNSFNRPLVYQRIGIALLDQENPGTVERYRGSKNSEIKDCALVSGGAAALEPL